MVPEEAWKAVVKEFGLTEGQPPISRKVVEAGSNVKYCKIEVYDKVHGVSENE